MIDQDNHSVSGHIGLLDIMSTLALLFILLAAIFMIDLREQNDNANLLAIENDSLLNANQQRIIYLSSLQRMYIDLQKENRSSKQKTDSMLFSNYLLIDSLKSRNMRLIQENRSSKKRTDSVLFSNYLLIDSLKSRNIRLIKELGDRQVAKIIIPNELKGKVFFKSGDSKIEGQFKNTLDNYVRMIKDSLASGRYNLVQVEGHTDSDKVGGKKRYKNNWELGSARAISVVQYFESQGIEPQYLSATTHSQHKPSILNNNSEAAKAQNRRIEIILLKK